jgi:hypothetical protein
MDDKSSLLSNVNKTFSRNEDGQSGVYPAIELAGRFAALTNSVAPIAPHPAIRLAQIFADASSDYRAGRGVNVETIEWPIVLARARDILSPSQLPLLEAVKARSESDRAVTDFVMARRTRK